jgi:hypothetical protein
MAEKSESIRCSGCGEVLKAGDEVVRIEVGTLKKRSFKAKKVWGLLHKSPCFNRAIDSPDAVMDEVRRLTESVSG